MTDPTINYWLATGLTPQKFSVVNEKTGESGESDQMSDVRKAALDRAHEVRKFEIELYWKRATYFWILQAAVFTAIGLTWKFADLQLSPLIPVVLAALGSITALAGWLSARGSKFWQENWEHHIDMLEDEFEGRLHKTAYVGKDGVAWSVSGVNDHLAICFGVFWLVILVSTVFRANPDWAALIPRCFAGARTNTAQTILILVATVVASVALWSRTTNFNHGKGISYQDDAPKIPQTDLIDEARLSSVSDLAKLKRPFLVRRQPKI